MKIGENFPFLLIFDYLITFFYVFVVTFRALSVSAVNSQSSESWLNKLLKNKISPNEAAKESHSSMLSGTFINNNNPLTFNELFNLFVPDKEILYALHTHNVRADSTANYLEN